MKKSRFLALALVVAVMLMGAGYAAWTDKLTITNTVDTGHMDVNWVTGGIDNDTVYPNANTKSWTSVPENQWRHYAGNDTYSQATAVLDASDPNNVNVTVTDLYPGSIATANLLLKNDSTMPVILNGFTVTFTDTANAKNLKDILLAGFSYKVYDANGAEKTGDNQSGRKNSHPGGFGTLRNFETFLNTHVKGLVLLPGEYLAFDGPEDEMGFENCIKFQLPLNVVNSDNVEDASISFKIGADFVQYNDPEAFHNGQAELVERP